MVTASFLVLPLRDAERVPQFLPAHPGVVRSRVGLKFFPALERADDHWIESRIPHELRRHRQRLGIIAGEWNADAIAVSS